ncbi:AraC family ligand binding domain-containing protein, partial [Acinetobacter baumannii]
QAFSCRGAGHVSAAGQIMAFNPDEPHDGHALDAAGFTYCMIYLTPGTVQAVLADAAERPAGLPWARAPVIDDPKLGDAILRLHR